MAAILREAAPGLESVTLIGALVEFTSCEGKLRVLGDKIAASPAPVPLSETELVPILASLATVRVPVKVPSALGWKTTLILAVPPGDRVRGRDGCEVTAKGARAVIPFRIRLEFP